MIINRIGSMSGRGTTTAYSVASAANNGSWYTWSSIEYFNNTSDSLSMGYTNPNYYHAFARFGGIVIPAGATITDARLMLYKTDADAAAVRIYFNDTDTPAAPTDYDTAEAKILTTAYVDWTLPGAVGWTISPNIGSIVQELLDTPYTYSGTQYMMALIRGVSGGVASLASYQGGNVPTLTITHVA